MVLLFVVLTENHIHEIHFFFPASMRLGLQCWEQECLSRVKANKGFLVSTILLSNREHMRECSEQSGSPTGLDDHLVWIYKHR